MAQLYKTVKVYKWGSYLDTRVVSLSKTVSDVLANNLLLTFNTTNVLVNSKHFVATLLG